MEHTNDLIFILNQNFEIEYINENVIRKSLRYLKEDLIGKNPLELIHWKDQKIANTNFNGNLQESNNIVKLRIKDQNNNYFQHEFKRKIFIDRNGALKILIVSRKIDKPENFEEKLNVVEETYRLITKNANDLIRVLDDRFEFEYIN